MANEFKVRKGLVVNGSGSVILDVQGSQGQLFSVTDQLSGSLFSVNDISGVPVLEAFSDSTVKIGQYLSEAIIVSGSTARITGSIAMAGFSSGSVLFAGLGGSISQNNASFFWDNVNGRLGIGTNTPTGRLDIRRADTGTQSSLYIINSSTTGTNNIMLGEDTSTKNLGFGWYGSGASQYRSLAPSTAYMYVLGGGSQLSFNTTTATQPITFATNDWNERMRIFGGGNINIGGGNTPSDTGERLQVSGSSRFVGDMVITGSGATSATYGLTIQNSNGVNTFRVRNDGVVTVEAVNTVAVLSMSSNGDSYLSKSTSGTNGISLVGPASAHHTLTISSFNSDNYSNGALSSLRFAGNFISSTGNTAFSYMLLNGTINQTGTSTSIIRGLYINPTITSASNFRAIEWSNNISGSTSWGLYGVGSAPNYLSGSLSIGPATNEGLSFQYVQDNTLGGSFASRIVSLASGVAYRDLFLVSRAVLFQQQGYINSLYISPNGNTVLNSLTDDGVNKLQVSGSARITDGLVVTGSTTITSNLTAIGGNVSLASVGGSVTFINGYNNQIIANRIHLYSTPTNIRGINAGNQGWILSKFTGASDLYPSSIFAIDSTTQGFLVPRMSVTQRTAITNPNQGLLVYDTSSATEGLWMYNSGSNPGWQEVLTNSGSQSISGSITATSFTGSLFGTSSWAVNVLSSSYSQTSSYLNPLNQTVVITGSLNISGSTTQVGSNNLLGNTRLSGSIIISGSLGTNNPTVQIYGDTQHNGYIRFDPVSTNIDASVSASYIYVSGSTNDLYFSQNGSGYANTTRLRWLEGNLYTGLLHGGLISISTGSTWFNLSSGSGVIVNLNASITTDPYPTITYVNWGNFVSQSITYLTSSIQSYIGIDSSGQITQQNTPFNDGEYNTKILIGSILHQNKTTVNASITYPNVAYGYKQRTYDFIKAFGPLKLSGYTINPSSSLGLTIGGGTAWADGRNYQVDPNNPSYIIDAGTTVSKIFRYYQSGSEFVQDTNGGLGYTVLDPANYNNNGTLTSISPSTPFTIQRVFWYPNSATKGIVVYYGNAQYASISDAAANLGYETFNEVENTKQNAVYLGAVIIKYNGVFTTPADYTILPGGIFRSVGGSGGGGGSSVTTRLVDLSDVNISGPTNLQPLAYDSTSTKWINTSVISASISGNANTATTALTASSADNFTVRGTLTAQTIVAQTVTSSILYSSGSNIFGNSLSNTQVFTGSVRITGSLQLTGDTVLRGSGNTSATNALQILNSTGASLFNIRNDGLGTLYGNLLVASLYPYLQLIPTSWGSFYIQSGVNLAANAAGDYTLFSNPSSKGFAFLQGSNVSMVFAPTTNNVTIGATTDTGERLQVSGSSRFAGNMIITGSANITQALTASAAIISGSGTQRLTVVGSGSAQPLFTVQGSQGELFSIVDSLSGSLFSVNDQSGLPIMEVFSDNTILMGNYIDPMLLTTARTSSAAGINTLYTLPTSSYDAVYIDYTIRSGSNARAGNFMAMWSGTSVNFTDNSITEFGTTSGFVFGAHISGSNMVVTGSSSTSGWTVKTIIKAI